MNRDDLIELAREAGFMQHLGVIAIPNIKNLERFATLAIAPHQKRADALAETINALRYIVTDDTETKSEFIARVREILSACPDTRVLQAVLAEREECAQVCDAIAMEDSWEGGYAMHCADMIRARNPK